VTVAAAGLCTGGAITAAGAAPPALVPMHHLRLTTVDAGDFESPHPAEPGQTFDGPAALYSVTASTTHLIRTLPLHGGAASTTYIASAASY